MARAAKKVLVAECQKSLKPLRIVNGTDSKVSLGAFAKGRSSSKALNHILRGCLGWAVMGRKQFKQFYVNTHDNPADDPSRGRPVRKPKPMPENLEHLILPQCNEGDSSVSGLVCQECYAGKAGLSRELGSQGLATSEPMEAYPSKHVYLDQFDLDRPEVIAKLEKRIKRKQIFYLHFGIPCSSWSTLMKLIQIHML